MRILIALILFFSLTYPSVAVGVSYMPNVTAEMSDPSYWASLRDDAQDVILTSEEIEEFNQDTALVSGTMIMDLTSADEQFDGQARNEAIKTSATADAEYYFGWTYGIDGKKADWSYYEKMIDNCRDPKATSKMNVRYGVAVARTTLQVFPSENPIWDDPKDPDFNYQHLSAVCVNDPLLLYTTSKDGKYYLARSRDCSGWISVEDVAVCADKDEWLSAWNLPSEQLLVIYGSKVYTDTSNFAPEISRRMLTQGTALELVSDLEPDQLVNNRSPYHNYVVYLPVRLEDGSYEKRMALIPESAEVSIGFLPLTQENLAMVTLQTVGDVYGWGGMMDSEDCSGMVRTIYACFGLRIGRNGNWQWEMNLEKVDMAYMSLEEKCLILDKLPIGAALCFPGHEMVYLGKVDGKYYVVSSVSSVMSPDTGNRLRTRSVMINTLDVKRANGMTWLQALNKALVPCYAKLDGKTYDFPELRWYHDGVAYCLKNNILNKESDGSFGIGKTVSRAALAQVFWTMAGKPEVTTDCTFTDVPEDHANRAAITWVANMGIMAGYSDTIFGTEDMATRQQMVTALWRYDQTRELPVEAVFRDVASFKDADSICSYAYDAFCWACGVEIVVGDGNGQLYPDDLLQREQLAVMLYQYSQAPRMQLTESVNDNTAIT